MQALPTRRFSCPPSIPENTAKTETRAYIFILPPELIEQIVNELPTTSIFNFLMVNRLLTTICEPVLYREIRLGDKPRRTYHLLNTFILRPDLALRVQHLEIDLLHCDVKDQPEQSSFSWALEALSLLKNIRSLSFAGNEATLWSADMRQFRILVSRMGLTSLSVEQFRPVRRRLPLPPLVYNRTLVEFLRLQPQLKDLDIDHFSFPPDFDPSPSYLPNLRTLRTTGPVAAKLISAAPPLRILEIRKGDCNRHPFDFSTFVSSAAVELSISELVLHLPHPQQWASRNVASVFAVFSNIEKLAVSVDAKSTRELASPDSFFDPIIQYIHPLQNLQQLELRRNAAFAIFGVHDFGEDYMMRCKSVCPQLTTFIDLSRRIWRYQTSVGSPQTHLVGQLLPERLSPLIDLPVPSGNGPPSSQLNASNLCTLRWLENCAKGMRHPS